MFLEKDDDLDVTILQNGSEPEVDPIRLLKVRFLESNDVTLDIWFGDSTNYRIHKYRWNEGLLNFVEQGQVLVGDQVPVPPPDSIITILPCKRKEVTEGDGDDEKSDANPDDAGDPDPVLSELPES